MEWERDDGLRLRVLLALAVVALMPVAFVYTLVFLVNTVGLDLLAWATDRPWNGRLVVPLWAVVPVVAGGFVIQYAFGERMALRSVGARRVSADEEPAVHATLSRLAAQVDAPVPSLAVSESSVPNAFTVGRRPSAATVVVTRGLLETLDEREREAVLAHELAHVKNRDVTVMTFAYFLPTLTYTVAIAAFFLLRGVFHALGSFEDVDGDGAKGVVAVVVVLVVSAVLTLAVSALFWAGSFLLFRLLSQYREYAADRGAASITGDPLALASALRTLDESMSALPDADLREQDGGLEALYVAPIDTYQFGGDRELLSSDIFPSTHPSTADRVERLQALAADLETGTQGASDA
ncbi:M48 family metalloprotease [Salinigranum salinum]|uniref:M48 family metalloprotease n=1 Tax=Salinigranum salinum TaxID=1364937 RepID=UPI0012604214|nr:M48 family metalloprotease [Salinigranum salinum]